MLLEPVASIASGMPCCPERTAAGACFSVRRDERFALWRRWSDGPLVGYLLMNPSIADETILDPTLKRCAAWAKAQGYGGMEIVNVFPFVSSKPEALKRAALHLSRECNAWHIQNVASRTTLVLGFGDLLSAPWLRSLALPALRAIESAISPFPVYALATTASGLPRHPLARGRARIPNDATYQPYDLALLRSTLARNEDK